MNAHHKNSWKFYPDQRFDVNNLVSLCNTCHKQFHNKHGNGKSQANTVEQYDEFKKDRKHLNHRKDILLVVGAPGSGKSWVCNQLSDRVFYYEYDKSDRKNIRSKLWNIDQPQIVCDLYSHISTFITRNSDIFNVLLYVIDEEEETIKSRLEKRNGTFTDSAKKRVKRMRTLSKRALFSGTSTQVLERLTEDLPGH